MCIFDFSLPIGWDEIGVIATVAAVIVALAANRKAAKQLESALKMQEQSKNVGLIDKRIFLIEEIRMGREVSELSMQILFDEEIAKSYQKLKSLSSSKEDATRRFRQLENAARFKNSADSVGKKIVEKNPIYQELDETDLESSRKQVETLTENISSEKDKLLKLMEAFISKSIKPIE